MGIRIDGNNDLIKAVDDTLTIEGISINTVGLMTATGGVKVGTAATIHSTGQFNIGVAHTLFANGNATHSGIVTASSFVGSGANLTGITQTTITGNANNRVVTGSDTSNTLIAETGLTYDTQTLLLNNTSANPQFHLTSAANGLCEVKFGDANDATRGNIIYRNGTSGEALCFHGYNNTERMRITSDGGIGIGTTNPYVLNEPAKFNELTIGGKTEGAAITLRDDNGNVQGGLFTSDNTGAMIVRTITNHFMQFRTNNTERLRIANDGQIKQTAASGDTIITLKRSDTNTTGAVGVLNFAASDDHSVANIQVLGDGDNEGAHIVFKTTSAAASADPFNAATVERLRITSTGNVGIASDVPTVALDVVGDTHLGSKKFVFNGTSGHFGIYDSSTDTTPDNDIQVVSSAPQIRLEENSSGASKRLDLFVTSGGQPTIAANQSSQSIAFETTGSERFRITNDGVTFNGDTAEANALDDYEKGTFTPQMHDGNSSNVVLTGTNCLYTKVGRMVNISGQITLNDTGKSGILVLTHLPFNCNSVDQLAAGSWWMDRGFSNDTVGGVCYKQASNATMRFVNPTAVHTNASGDDAAKSATRYLEFSQWQNGRHIYFNLTYNTSG